MSREFKEIKDRCEKKLSNKPDKITWTAKEFRLVIWIYIYWMIRAAINGYPIKIRTVGMFALHKEPVRGLSEDEKKRYFLSNRLFGPMFTLKFTGKKFPDHFYFYPNQKIIRKLGYILDSDTVYELNKS